MVGMIGPPPQESLFLFFVIGVSILWNEFRSSLQNVDTSFYTSICWYMIGSYIYTGIVWTASEYVFHRWILHSATKLGYAHQKHHLYPRQAHRLLLPVDLTAPNLVVHTILSRLLFNGCFTRWTLGWNIIHYCIFEWTHMMSHQRSQKQQKEDFVQMKTVMAHRIHHVTNRHNYGFTCLFWDRFAGTYAGKYLPSWIPFPLWSFPDPLIWSNIAYMFLSLWAYAFHHYVAFAVYGLTCIFSTIYHTYPSSLSVLFDRICVVAFLGMNAYLLFYECPCSLWTNGLFQAGLQGIFYVWHARLCYDYTSYKYTHTLWHIVTAWTPMYLIGTCVK